MATNYRKGPWTVADDMLKSTNGTHLFQLVEQPGLGNEAESIIAIIEHAPAVLAAAKRVLEVYVMGGGAAEDLRKAIAKAEGR